MKNRKQYIGINHLGKGIIISRIVSSYDKEFKDEKVLIGNGIADIVPCMIGNISDAYELLKLKTSNCNLNDIEEVSKIVFNVVQEYFGDFSNISSRMEYYNSLDFIESDDDIGKVSNLKGKNAAMCVERAMLSQNLLKTLGIESYYKASMVENNGALEGHSYNLVSYKDNYYIFDATIPSIKNNDITPLVACIPKHVYDKMKSSDSNIGYSTQVSHFNPLRNKDVTIVYDIDRKEKYVCVEEENVIKR